MALHNAIGIEGEQLAQQWLKNHGYTILDINWRYRHYELDIIAQYLNNLIVVEVKTRHESSYTAPEEAVDKKKIRRIVSATDTYCRKHKVELNVRFDIIAITYNLSGNYQLTHIEDAFMAPIY